MRMSPNWFQRNILGAKGPETNIVTSENQMYAEATRVQRASASNDEISKAFNGRDVAFKQPIIPEMSLAGINPHYKEPTSLDGTSDIHRVLHFYSSHAPLFTAIVNVRIGQAIEYAQPARQNERGVGFEIRLRDPDSQPTKAQKRKIREAEHYLENMGVDQSVSRDNFQVFLKKIIWDTYRYDQVNFENTFSGGADSKLLRTQAVDPATIFWAVGKDGQVPKTGKKIVQVFNHEIKHAFTEDEMAMCIRNPRSDIQSVGYGAPELEVALREFIAHENTEAFNDRFFSHGGTTRGILNIKTPEDQSRHALDIFRRQWNSNLSSLSGAWKIPVLSAEDVKFVNMTPTANDMQFEKWLNYLINIISATFGIDPAEIGFPNRGGATGSKSHSLNEGNSRQKNQESQNKGLQPLMRTIESWINTHIIPYLVGSSYVFKFVGGDSDREMEKIAREKEEVTYKRTPNEIRAEMGLPAVPGGDIILNAIAVQRVGQMLQQKQMEHSFMQERVSQLAQDSESAIGDNLPTDGEPNYSGGSQNAMGGDKPGAVKKDGQVRGRPSANKNPQGGTTRSQNEKR